MVVLKRKGQIGQDVARTFVAYKIRVESLSGKLVAKMQCFVGLGVVVS